MTDPAPPLPARKGRGCLFYGCLTCVIFALLLCLLGYLGMQWLKGQVNAYTDPAPAKLPAVQMSDPEFQALQQRVQQFGAALEQNKPTPPLVLTERDVNALLTKQPNTRELADKVYVSLEGDQVKGQVSIPVGEISPLFRGRYLNGEATFRVSLQNGVLIVTAEDIKVKGKSLPETFLSEFRKENLAKDAYRDARNAEMIGKLESISVENGKAIVKARAPQ